MARYSNSVTLDDTGVVPGSYTSANIVVNSKGQIILASNGGSSGGGPTGSLDDLVDVNVTTATSGQVLTFNGSIWVSTSFDLNLLTDVSLSTPTAGHILYYTGSEWTNGPASTANLVTQNDIGTLVQAQNSKLDFISNLTGTSGFLTFNGANLQKVQMTAIGGGGLKVVNGDAANSPIQFGMDLSNLAQNTAISTLDELLINDVSASTQNKATIGEILLAGGAITDGQTLGSGADIFVLAQNGIAQFRGILSNSTGIIISTDPDDVLIGLSPALESLGLLTPTAGNIIVGDGTQWSSQTPAEVKTSLGLGSMADADVTDYLAIDGGTMAGDIDMSNFTLINLPMPTNDGDAANKAYVDAQLSTGVVAGNGLTKTGNTIDIVAADSSITVNADSIQLNTAFTDNLYFTKTEISNSTLTTEGADLVGTSLKAALGNSTTVEEALAFINTYFATSLPKFSMDLSALWNLDVGVPNVNNNIVRDSKVAVFDPSGDSAIYVDFVIPANYDTSYPLTFYANVSKEVSQPTTGSSVLALAYQYQRPNVAPTNYPSRGPAPNWEFTTDVKVTMSNADDLIHTLTWSIPASVFEPLDTVTLRFSRLSTDSLDTYAGSMYLFSTLIAQ